jgi:23S rRNA A2030 N6-methylase RlmJ
MSTVRQRNVPGQQQKEALMAQADIKAREEEQQMLAAGQKFVPPPFTIKQLLDAIPLVTRRYTHVRSSHS